MSEPPKVIVENLPTTDDKRLRVELVPMPSGDDPWRTRADYQREQRRDTIRFFITIAALITSILGVAATATIAIVEIRRTSRDSLAASEPAALSPSPTTTGSNMGRE